MKFKKSNLVVMLTLVSVLTLAGCSALSTTVNEIAASANDLISTSQHGVVKPQSEVVLSSETSEVVLLQESEILMIIEESYPHGKVVASAYDKENNLYNAKILDSDDIEYNVEINACTGEILKHERMTKDEAAE